MQAPTVPVTLRAFNDPIKVGVVHVPRMTFVGQLGAKKTLGSLSTFQVSNGLY